MEYLYEKVLRENFWKKYTIKLEIERVTRNKEMKKRFKGRKKKREGRTKMKKKKTPGKK